MSKVSEKCKLRVLSLVSKHKLLCFKFKTAQGLATEIYEYYGISVPYSKVWIANAIGELLADGRLIKSKSGYIGIPEKTAGTEGTSVYGVTKEQVLKAAKTSPQAHNALMKLFPKFFIDDNKLVKFNGGLYSGYVGAAIQEAVNENGIFFVVANGLAPTDELKNRTLCLQGDRSASVALVIFDKAGKQIFKSNGVDDVFIGFVKK